MSVQLIYQLGNITCILKLDLMKRKNVPTQLIQLKSTQQLYISARSSKATVTVGTSLVVFISDKIIVLCIENPTVSNMFVYMTRNTIEVVNFYS